MIEFLIGASVGIFITGFVFVFFLTGGEISGERIILRERLWYSLFWGQTMAKIMKQDYHQ